MRRFAGLVIIVAVVAAIAAVGFQELVRWQRQDVAELERIERSIARGGAATQKQATEIRLLEGALKEEGITVKH